MTGEENSRKKPVTREEALALLRSGSDHERYLAAKLMVRQGRSSDVLELMTCRKNERDSYAKKWLDFAIAACLKRGQDESSKLIHAAAGVGHDEKDLIRTQAVEWVASALLHEIGSKIGLLTAAAREEVQNYEGSDTRKILTNLVRIFEAIAELRKAAAPPRLSEFDLAQLIEEISHIETVETNIDVSLVGRRPLLVQSDPDLIRLALCNGIRNAVEAVKGIVSSSEHKVVITWEITDREFWISVIDDGPGVIGPSDLAFEIGRTNKVGHAGFGLAVARQAMERLQGSVRLLPSAAGGAVYELRGNLKS